MTSKESKSAPPSSRKLAKAKAALIDHALAFPQTTEDHPWGETAIKVKGKAFLFLGSSEKKVTFSVKLPQSRDFALEHPGTEPTHYGLGKHGWVTITLERGDEFPIEMLRRWIEESFRSVAPKSVLREMKSV